MAGDTDNVKPAKSSSPWAQEPLPEDMALEIDRVSRNDTLTGPAGAAVRSMLISGAIVAGAVWLMRLLLGRMRTDNRKKENG